MSQLVVVDQEAVPSIHDYNPEWMSDKPEDFMAVLTVCRAADLAIEKMFDYDIKRPKFIKFQLCEIPLPEDDGSEIVPARIMGKCAQPYMPKEGSIPGDLVIDIDINQTYEEMAHTVVHEMTHAHQIFTGRMGLSRINDINTPYIKMWCGKSFSTRLMEYKDYPWEIEANAAADKYLPILIEQERVASANAARQAAALAEINANATTEVTPLEQAEA